MDPKMDSGIVRRYYSEAIDSGAAPVPLSSDRTVDVQCVIAIMDHLLACEATWHKGHSLAQTVFRCIYLLKPDRTSPHALLHSYCKLLLRNLRLYIFHRSIRLVCCLVRINPIASNVNKNEGKAEFFTHRFTIGLLPNLLGISSSLSNGCPPCCPLREEDDQKKTIDERLWCVGCNFLWLQLKRTRLTS